MAKNEEFKPSCSFCGKGQDMVRRLIAGPGVYICDECIDLCVEIIEEDYDFLSESGSPEKLPLLIPHEINAVFSSFFKSRSGEIPVVIKNFI